MFQDAGAPPLKSATPLPKHGQTIIFERVPAGSYCRPNKPYRVEHSDNKGHFRFVNDRNGIGTFDEPWAVAHSTWKLT
jgi:hypothetical protein